MRSPCLASRFLTLASELALLLPFATWAGPAKAAAPSPQLSPLNQANPWEPVGLSGGGGMFAPAISGADPNLMLINCRHRKAAAGRDPGMEKLAKSV